LSFNYSFSVAQMCKAAQPPPPGGSHSAKRNLASLSSSA